MPLGILPGHLIASNGLVEKRQQLRTQERRSQDLMLFTDHDLLVSQANGDIWADHVSG
jgi:hypothetical protein